MGSDCQVRKVLFIEGEKAIGKFFHVVLHKLGCQGEVAGNGEQAVAMISRDEFDAVLLDLRSSKVLPEDLVSEIHEIRPSLIGRVLVITGEVSDRETLDLVDRYFLLRIPADRVINDLMGWLRALLHIAPSPIVYSHRVSH
jgi:DNA-binding NtrC family response regulator